MRGERPNTRVQRTRSSPSAPHSPLTRNPLGRFARHCGGALTVFCLVALTACKSTQPAQTRTQIDQARFGRLNDLLRTARAAVHAQPLVPDNAMAALKAVTPELEVVRPFEQTEDEKWYGGAVLIAVAMASAEVYGLKQHWNESDGRLENIDLLDCFFDPPEGCFANTRPCAPIDGDTECVKKARR